MVVKIKNADSVPHTWVGQTIAPGDYYTVQAFELIRWQYNSILLSAIGSGLAVVNDGSADILDVSTAIAYLQNLSVPYAANTGGDVPAQAVLIGGANISGDIEAVNIDPSNNLEVVGIGVAGAPAGGVVSVQGVAGGTNVPVSISSSVLPTGAATSANQTNGNQLSQTVDASGHVQPVGDVPSRAMYVEPTDGTHSITIKPASTAAVVGDTAQVVALSPNTPLPAGTNNIGTVTLATESIEIGEVDQGNANTVGNAWTVKATDGVNTMAVKAASTAAVAADPSAVVALSPNSPLPTGANNVGSITNVTGTISLPTGAATNDELVTINSTLGSPMQNTGGTVTVIQPTGTNLHTVVDSSALPTGAATAANQTNGSQETQIVAGGNTATVTAASALKVDGSAVTQPISASSLPLPTGAATSANQTNGTQLAQTVDAAGHVQPAGDVAARAIFVEPTDGTHSITIKAASTAAIATDTSEVVALSPNTPLPAGTNALGTVAVTGVTEVSPTSAANTVSNPFFNEITDGTNAMGAMANFGTSPGAVKALDVNASIFSGTTALGTPNTFGTTAPTGNALGVNASLFVGTALASTSAPVPISATTAANTVSNPIFVEPSDGTRSITIKAASTASVAADTSLVTAFSPNSPLPTGSNVIGALTANQSVNLNQVGGNAVVTGGTNGSQGVGGLAAAGAAIAGNPVLVGGSDGTDARALLTDTSGRQEIVGAAATGAAVAGNPVLVGGSDGTDARTMATDSSGNVNVVGNVASASADSGNPVKTGGKYNTTVVAPSNGNRVDTQVSSDGSTIVAQRFKYATYVNTAGTTTLKTGEGILHTVSYTTPVNGSIITIYDNTAGSGTIITIITPPNPTTPVTLHFDAQFSTGLTFVTTGTGGWSISYR